ncbi:alpha/beta fold hydrolase [Propioniciclava soli]|uniref:Alpha/beta fold hydrolase n=1 Tax=Propioniciclava soli TaxID=2775081 RepID=A0ABZ3C9M3_9ACTN
MPTYTHDGLTFDYTDAGAGEPVVLLHGFPEDAQSWQRVAPLLHDAGLRTLAPEQRGYSPGAKPKRRGDYTLDKLSGDVLALLDAAGIERAHVVGHDWGGGVAWDLATRHPQRVASLVVLATPHPSAAMWAIPRSKQALRSWYMGFFQLPWLPERAGARVIERMLTSSGLNAEDARRYAERYADPARLTGPMNWYRAIPLSQPATDLTVRVPTTYVWGNGDPYLDRVAAEKTRDFVAADYRFVELDATHWLPQDEPDAVATAIIERVMS